jgi:hypothetical protein
VGFCGGGQGLSWAVEPRREKRGEGMEGWREVHIEGLHNLYSFPNIIRVIKSRMMSGQDMWHAWER